VGEEVEDLTEMVAVVIVDAAVGVLGSVSEVANMVMIYVVPAFSLVMFTLVAMLSAIIESFCPLPCSR
jgi:hypothetical protein